MAVLQTAVWAKSMTEGQETLPRMTELLPNAPTSGRLSSRDKSLRKCDNLPLWGLKQNWRPWANRVQKLRSRAFRASPRETNMIAGWGARNVPNALTVPFRIELRRPAP